MEDESRLLERIIDSYRRYGRVHVASLMKKRPTTKQGGTLARERISQQQKDSSSLAHNLSWNDEDGHYRSSVSATPATPMPTSARIDSNRRGLRKPGPPQTKTQDIRDHLAWNDAEMPISNPIAQQSSRYQSSGPSMMEQLYRGDAEQKIPKLKRPDRSSINVRSEEQPLFNRKKKTDRQGSGKTAEDAMTRPPGRHGQRISTSTASRSMTEQLTREEIPLFRTKARSKPSHVVEAQEGGIFRSRDTFTSPARKKNG